MKSKDQQNLEEAYTSMFDKTAKRILNEQSSSVMYGLITLEDDYVPELLGVYSTKEKAESARSTYIEKRVAKAYDERSRREVRISANDLTQVKVIPVDQPPQKLF